MLNDKEVSLYKSESNRLKEQKFLRGITDNYKNVLKFSTSTCTDGNIVEIYPDHPFIQNQTAVENTCKELKLDDKFKNSTWLLLKTFARGGTVHEAFHILFTDFETLKIMKKEFKNKHSYKYEIMHDIMNIIEDSFIELAGINYLPGLEFYISFSNKIAFNNIESLDEIEKKLKDKQTNRINLFLHWAMMYAIMGKIKGKITDRKIKNRIKKSKKYFDLGRKETNCMKRYEYAKEIYKIVEDLIEEAIKEQNMFDFNYFKNKLLPKLLEGSKPKDVDIKKDFKDRLQDSSLDESEQNDNQNSNNQNNKDNKDKDSSSQNNSQIQNEEDDLSGNKSSDVNKNNSSNSSNLHNDKSEKDEEKQKEERDAIDKLVKEMEEELRQVEKEEEKRKKEEEKEKELERKINRELKKIKYSEINKGIRVNVIKKFDEIDNKEQLYKQLYEPNKPLIKSFIKMFQKLIKDQSPSWTNKLVIGSHLDTRRMADPKRRNWKRKNEMKEKADLNIMVVIDGSGSMRGNLMQVVQAIIIIYEVAKALNIPICVVEERAIYFRNIVEHKILIDYRNYKKDSTKYNLLHLSAKEGTREGVSLKWCHAYQKMQPNKDTLMIVIADGNPEHSYKGIIYKGSISASDTKKVADEIQKQGTNLISIALGEYCYPSLKQIYKHTILCDNLNKLPKQMIRILEKNLFKN